MNQTETINTLSKMGLTIGRKNPKYTQALETAIKAVELQQAKPCEDIQSPVVPWGICPNCHGLPPLLGKPRRVFSNENYCSNCGQRIEWR